MTKTAQQIAEAVLLKLAFNLSDARKAVKAVSKHRVRAASHTDDLIGIVPGMLRKPKGVPGKWIPTNDPAVTMPQHILRGGKATPKNVRNIDVYSSGDVGANIAKQLPAVEKNLHALKPRQREMVNRISLLHEDAERRAMKRLYSETGLKVSPEVGYMPSSVDTIRENTPLSLLQQRSGGHMSPDILVQESNMLSTLPPEMKGVRSFFDKVRQNESDEGVLALVRNVLPSFEYGKTRLNRHQRKALLDSLLQS